MTLSMRNGRERKNRGQDTYTIESYEQVRDTFEVVSYRDSIKIVDFAPFCQKLGLSCYDSFELWIVKDICGTVCVALTWFLLLFAESIVCGILFYNFFESVHTAVNGIIFQCLTFLAAVSHLRCMFTDPGAIPRGNATRENISKLNLPDGEIIYRCPKCVCVKPERAHHCRVCRRCVRKMDHHCPWVNNCVGEDNQKYFILFTMYTCIISCHSLYMAIYQLVVWTNNDWQDYSSMSPVAAVIFLSMLMFEAVIFGIFTGVMFSSQLWAVCTDETYIEHVKKESRLRASSWLAIKAVFGHTFSYRWFSPFHAGPVDMSSLSYLGLLTEVDAVWCSV